MLSWAATVPTFKVSGVIVVSAVAMASVATESVASAAAAVNARVLGRGVIQQNNNTTTQCNKLRIRCKIESSRNRER